jgi:formylglycine-generating enzyme required for sulfatase activity
LSSDRAKQVRKVFAPTDLSWGKVLRQDPDPTVVTNPELLNAISNTGLPWCVRDIGTGIEMLLIPPGTFQMGDTKKSLHQVKLTKAFYLGRYQVTQAQWQGKMGNNPSYFKDRVDSASRPVEEVSWNDIAGFNTATGLRLPTEAEWEYACRAGTTTQFHSMPGYPNGTNDDSLLGNIAWCGSNNSPSGTKPVGGKAANAFGMYDMSGNVEEWCNDWYCDYIDIDFGRIQPTGPTTGDYRVLRGGYWSNGSNQCRSSYRGIIDPGSRHIGVGFRVARTP